jgi:hypothetical protein
MSLYHFVELGVVSGAVLVAVGAAYKRFMPKLSAKGGAAKAAAGCSSCSSCGSCSTGPASVDEPGAQERPLVFQSPRQ